MADVLSDSVLWSALVVGTGIGIVISRLLHHSWPGILINVAGTVAFLVGLRWAIVLGTEAFIAASVASGGVALWDVAARVHNRHRERSTGPDSAMVSG